MIGALAVTTGTLHAQSQSELTQDACAKYKKADQTLNATYTKVLKDYVKDPQFLAKLRQAQRTWLAFRDAHLEARFPKSDKQAEYGSMYSTCRCTLLSQLTEQTHARVESLGGRHSRGRRVQWEREDSPWGRRVSQSRIES